jgi:hypothetical protein
MASRWKYECYACKRLGMAGVLVYLDGKDSEGNTQYLNTDTTFIIIKVKTATDHRQEEQQQQIKGEIMPLLRDINAKLDRLLTRFPDYAERKDDRNDGRLGDGFLIE